ncbi:S1C family serine protease [Rubritalea tangerina]|uniref:S1C family serine protease n=1 Tax=Rubritalea tangerina TaxID=430798 RepID=UPI00360F0F98
MQKLSIPLVCLAVMVDQPVWATPPAIEDLASLKKLQSQVVELVEKVQPATVSLTSERTGAWGSGVVVSEKGRILTAAHVVQGASVVTVIFPDGTETTAAVLGANRTKDTAMLQINEVGEYPHVKLGDSDALSVGDFLVAMGHAGGHDPLRKPPVRFGRLISKNMAGFFTSDCTLIGGDSGGPIFDIEGKLVGINSSIGVDWSANNHAGISALVADWKRLEAGETWGRLSSNPFANEDSPILGVGIVGSTRQGVLLGQVIPGSPAQRSGIKKGDIVVSVDGKKVTDGGALLVELNRFRPGQSVKMEILRGEVLMEIEPTLARRGDLYQQ